MSHPDNPYRSEEIFPAVAAASVATVATVLKF